MDFLETIIIAIVEGLTEFLPVSSTGHMIITQSVLGVESTPFVRAFTVIIQFGAILSVVCLYWKRFFRLNRTPLPGNPSALRRFLHTYDFYWKLLVAFIPAAIFGLLLGDWIDTLLENVVVVAVMLVIGDILKQHRLPTNSKKVVVFLILYLNILLRNSLEFYCLSLSRR